MDLVTGRAVRYARVMRYPGDGDLYAAERTRREQMWLVDAVPVPQVATASRIAPVEIRAR